MPRVIVSVGARSGRLVVVAASAERLHGRRAVVAKCDCGSAPFLVRESAIRSNHTRSCGGCRQRVSGVFEAQSGVAVETGERRAR